MSNESLLVKNFSDILKIDFWKPHTAPLPGIFQSHICVKLVSNILPSGAQLSSAHCSLAAQIMVKVHYAESRPSINCVGLSVLAGPRRLISKSTLIHTYNTLKYNVIIHAQYYNITLLHMAYLKLKVYSLQTGFGKN